MKNKVSEAKKINILNSVQVIGTLAECIEVEMMMEVTDARFKHPTINNHKRRLKESVNGISTYIGAIAGVLNRDVFSYEFAVEMHRLVTHFSRLSTEQIRDFMDRVDEELNK